MARTVVDAFLFDSSWGADDIPKRRPTGSKHSLDRKQLAKILRENPSGELTILVDESGNIRLR